MRPKKQRPIVVTQRDRALSRLRHALIASVVALVAGLAAGSLIVAAKFGQLEDALTAERDDRAAFESALNEANRDLAQEGLPPVDPPADVEPEQGLPGEPGEDGRPPTAAEILKAVASYCAAGKCRGPAGSSVTPAQVAGAVSAYCDSRGQCRGPLGVAGRNGSDGAPGPTGPPPTDAQVAAAVEAFCAGGRCQGVAGPPGPPGPAGEPGPACPPGFTSQQRLVITDDGPEQATLCVAG